MIRGSGHLLLSDEGNGLVSLADDVGRGVAAVGGGAAVGGAGDRLWHEPTQVGVGALPVNVAAQRLA